MGTLPCIKWGSIVNSVEMSSSAGGQFGGGFEFYCSWCS